jgi:hypothetical protein
LTAVVENKNKAAEKTICLSSLLNLNLVYGLNLNIKNKLTIVFKNELYKSKFFVDTINNPDIDNK